MDDLIGVPMSETRTPITYTEEVKPKPRLVSSETTDLYTISIILAIEYGILHVIINDVKMSIGINNNT